MVLEPPLLGWKEKGILALGRSLETSFRCIIDVVKSSLAVSPVMKCIPVYHTSFLELSKMF